MGNFQQEKNLQLLKFAEEVLKAKNKTLYNEFMAVYQENRLSKDELLDLLAKDNTTYNLRINAIHYVAVPYLQYQPTPTSEVSFCSFLIETCDGIVEIPCGEMSRDVMYLDYQDAEIIDIERLKVLEDAMKKQMTGFNKLLAENTK